MDGINYLNPKEPRIDKRVGASLNYGFRWVEWLADLGEGIASADVAPTGGLTVSNVAHQDGVVVCMATGGAVGTPASLKCTIVTDGTPAKTDTRTLHVDVID